MPRIYFTQYLRPDGRREQIHIDRPEEVWKKSCAIVEAGLRLEAEVLPTDGAVRLTVSGKNRDVAIELVFNQTPEKVVAAVDKLITELDIEAAIKRDEDAE